MAHELLLTSGLDEPLEIDVSTHVYKRVLNVDLTADIYCLPNWHGDRARPGIVWLHGGALILGTRLDIVRTRSVQLCRYLRAGWVVVAIDYRLAPESHLPEIWDDVRDAITWSRAVAPCSLDPSRVAVVGVSAGGYLALLSGALLQPAPAAVISWFGYGDITGDWYSHPSPHYLQQPRVTQDEAWGSVGQDIIAELPERHDRRAFYLYLRQQGLWPAVVGGPIDLRRYCPSMLITPQFPSTMLIHGVEDSDVPVSQSIDVAQALERNGVDHELLVVSGVGHSFDRDADSPRTVGALDAADAFLRRQFSRTGGDD